MEDKIDDMQRHKKNKVEVLVMPEPVYLAAKCLGSQLTIST